MLNIHDIIEGRVESLAFGGEGIIKHQGYVIFVPFTAPGETISCRIVKVKKNYAFAELTAIIVKSTKRVDPPCPYFGRCGGCQLQHLNYQTQVNQKEQFVKDAFLRIANFEDVVVNPIIPSKNVYGYRRHVSLRIQKTSNLQIAGYVGTDGKTLLQVDECQIFTEKQDPVLKQLQDFVSHFEMDEEAAKVTILKEKPGCYILHFHFSRLPKNAEFLIRQIKHYPSFAGVIFGSKNKTLTAGTIQVPFQIDGLSFTFSSDVFMQNNQEQSINIYHHLVKIAKEAKASQILDLYCGIGISSLLLAKEGIEVLGIESNHRSIKIAVQNAKANHLLNAKFTVARVEELLAKTKIPSFVVVNPPREGLMPQVIEILKAKRPKHIVYISCMPATLARDLKALGKDNYRITLCQPYDCFPQTTHVETVVSLTSTA